MFYQHAMKTVDLLSWITELPYASRPGGAQLSAKTVIFNERFQRVRQGQRISPGDQLPATFIDDLECPALSCGDDRQTCVQGFHECNPKCFRTRVGLAVNVGGGQETRNIGALSQKPDSRIQAGLPPLRLQLS